MPTNWHQARLWWQSRTCVFWLDRSLALGRDQRAPAPAATPDHDVGFVRTIRSGRVERQRIGPVPFPFIENRLNDAPSRFNSIGALKQARIADHAIIEQRFI